ncbi:hypothetical protein AB0G74_27760 [Streptomyces sp. NPDC020875]|uniref:hypothetical protein n=1 Tax=Streptomyces sp. NPDC020875 TaxID=3154898 RepID=UPI0033C489BA
MSDEIPEVPEVVVGRYAAPRVTIEPVTAVVSAEPVTGARRPGAYQRVLLNTATGGLAFHESTEHLEPWNPAWKAVTDVPRETWERWHPGKPFLPGAGVHMWFAPVPGLLSWTVDCGGATGRPYLNVRTANELLELVAPYAQDLLDGLFEAGGELDWSAASARAGRQLCRLTSRYRQAAQPEVDSDLVDYTEVVGLFPQAYRPQILGAQLDALADECEGLTRYLGGPSHPEITARYGRPYSDGSGIAVEVLGVRSWYRTVLLAGDPRPLHDFRDWEAEHRPLPGGITSQSTDAELDAWAAQEDDRAARKGLRLIGAQRAAYGHRTHLREQEWDRLAVVGSEVARLEAELSVLRSERLGLVRNAIERGRSDSDIGVRARMSRQAVHKIRTSKTGEDDDASS